MATVDYWLGDATETTATIVVRSDTSGLLTVSGATAESVAVDPATEYGVAKLTLTGLSADTIYPVSVLLDGVVVCSPNVRTMPASGSWNFGFGSCLSKDMSDVYGYQLVRDHDIRVWFALGDTPYCDAGTAWNGTYSVGRWYNTGAEILGTYADWQSGRMAWDRNYWALQQQPGWAYLTARVPTYRMPDDHEYGNDWDWSVNSWATLFTPDLTTQADMDTVGLAANQASWTWNKGNPMNSDPEIGNWAPSSCADAASNHPPKYYRKRVGDVEFFHLDWYAHMDPVGKADKARTVCIYNAAWNAALGYTYSDPSGAALAKTRLGPYQLNWLLTHLASSTATFKVIVSGKATHYGNATSDNVGLDPDYVVERDYILAWIKKFVTGVLWIAGDVHTPSVYNDLSGHCCVNSSPLGQVTYTNRTGTVNYSPGYKHPQAWRATGEAANKWVNKNAYGVVEVAATYLRPKIYALSGELLWSAYLKAGKNYLQPSLDDAGEFA